MKKTVFAQKMIGDVKLRSRKRKKERKVGEQNPLQKRLPQFVEQRNSR
jgi:hypothetical protein